MSNKISDSELIRRYALIHLIGYVDGIRSTDLRLEVEKSLGHTIPPDEYNKGKYRSALWNLDKLYPQWVIKKTFGRKEVYFYPTDQLFYDGDKVEIPEEVGFQNIDDEDFAELTDEFKEIFNKTMDILETLEKYKTKEHLTDEQLEELNIKIEEASKNTSKFASKFRLIKIEGSEKDVANIR